MTDDANLVLGMGYLQRGRADLAEAPLRRALAEDPDDGYRMAQLALALAQLGRSKEALPLAEGAVGRAPDEPMPMFVLAMVLLGLDRYKQAEARARELLEIEPDDADNLGLLAATLAPQRKWRAALEAAEDALEIDAEHETSTNIRATALIQLGEAEDADLALQATMNRDPENADTHENMGWAAMHRGEFKEARKHFREALRLDPSSDFARAGLVETIKAGNFLYRWLLKFGLFLTRIPAQYVVLFWIGTIAARRGLNALAEAMPQFAPLFLTLFWIIVAFVLLTWIAAPFFNMLLRFHPEGKHALSSVQRRQSNWFVAMLILFGVALGYFLFDGGYLAGFVALFAGFLVLPVVATAGSEGRAVWVPAAFTGALLILGVLTLHAGARLEARQADVMASLSSFPEEQIEEAQSVDELIQALPTAQQPSLRQRVRELERASSHLDTLSHIVVVVFVAFSWIGGGALSSGHR